MITKNNGNRFCQTAIFLSYDATKFEAASHLLLTLAAGLSLSEDFGHDKWGSTEMKSATGGQFELPNGYVVDWWWCTAVNKSTNFLVIFCIAIKS